MYVSKTLHFIDENEDLRRWYSSGYYMRFMQQQGLFSEKVIPKMSDFSLL